MPQAAKCSDGTADRRGLTVDKPDLAWVVQHYVEDVLLPLLPAAASALTGLQQLDIEGRAMSPAVAALTGADGFAGTASMQVCSLAPQGSFRRRNSFQRCRGASC
jgi:hypothetical protein